MNALRRSFCDRPMPTAMRELTWANVFAWSRQRIGDQVVWHLHTKTGKQVLAMDIAVSIHASRSLAAKQLAYVRNVRALVARGLKARGMW